MKAFAVTACAKHYSAEAHEGKRQKNLNRNVAARQLITSGNKLKNLDTEIFQLHLHPLGEHLLALFGGKGEKLRPIL